MTGSPARHRGGRLWKNGGEKRLAWRPGEATDASAWVERTGPSDGPNEPEATFRAFVDENIVEIFKADPSVERETPDAPRGDRLDFGVERKIAVSDGDSLARHHRLQK